MSVILKAENGFGLHDTIGEFDTHKFAVVNMLMEFDSGRGTNYIIEEGGAVNVYAAHKLMPETCPRCGRLKRVFEMLQTRDCHGIPYRRVCEHCYLDIMEDSGYDGEYYDETDECIDYDY